MRVAKSSLRILYLEDDKNDVELVQAKLKEEGFACDMTHVETQADFIAALDKGGFDVILADYKLPSFNGLSALSIARRKTPDVPFIFLSGVMGDELAIESLKNGATDYVLKQRLVRLAPAIRRALEEAEGHLERKKAQEANEKLNRQNELILNSASEGIFGLDLDGNHTFVNSAAAQMLGYRVRELIGKHSHEIWHHSRADGSPYPESECPIYSVCKYGIIRRLNNEVFWRKDGTSFPVAYTSTPILQGGKLTGAVVTFRDITKRKRVEEELRKHRQHLKELVEERTDELRTANERLRQEIEERRQIEERYRSLLASTEDSIYLLDKDYKYLFMNDWHKSRLGLEGDEYAGRSYSEFHVDDKTRWFVELADGVFNEGKSVRYKYQSRRDGRHYLVTLSPVKELDGTTTAITVVSKDVTDLRITAETEDVIIIKRPSDQPDTREGAA